MLRLTKNKNSNSHSNDAEPHPKGSDGGHSIGSPMVASDSVLRHRDDSSLSETQSEEDYDENFRPNIVSALDSRGKCRNGPGEYSNGSQDDATSHNTQNGNDIKPGFDSSLSSSSEAALSRSKQRRKFKDFVFTQQVSTFDAQSEAAVNSPFHGFYNLFWLSVALLICKISANNWRAYGNLLGPSDILKTMFHRDGT